jgi:hypothetical protein
MDRIDPDRDFVRKIKHYEHPDSDKVLKIIEITNSIYYQKGGTKDEGELEYYRKGIVFGRLVRVSQSFVVTVLILFFAFRFNSLLDNRVSDQKIQTSSLSSCLCIPILVYFGGRILDKRQYSKYLSIYNSVKSDFKNH